MQNQKSSSRTAFNIIVWILTLLWLCVIFRFSAMPAQQSSEQSSLIISVLNSLFNLDLSSGEIIQKFSIAQSIDFFVRKTAHFTEYAILGVLSFLSFSELGRRQARRRMFQFSASLIFCLLYAASDETHQLFVSGRSAAVRDVLIDFLGSVAGVAVILLVTLLKDKRKKRVAKAC
ncbi:MAG: VanZ family protein [Ruminococcus sp.]|nr:VanZ family protein [Ruminococcus sp.]